MAHRLFIGVKSDADILEELKARQQMLSTVLPECRFTKPELIHQTLHFLGDTESLQRDELREALARQPLGPFVTQTYDHWLPLPDRSRARVFSLAGPREGGLARLQHLIGEVLTRLGLPVEDRAFLPHLTFARFGRPQSITLIPVAQPLTLRFQSVILFESHLRPHGAEHEPLAEFRLAGPISP